MIHDNEQWRSIPGWEGQYDVSDRGRVRSWKNYSTPAPRILRAGVSGDGYLTVRLSRSGDAPTFHLHRLVLLAFVGPLPDEAVTRHLDGDPTNNRLDNLQYGTPGENIRDAVRHGTYRNGFGERTHCKRGHEFTEENTIRRPSRPNHRGCRECNRAASREYQRKNADALRQRRRARTKSEY